MFNRRWWWVTLVVILGVGFLIRLGTWQLDRLEQRRAFNTMVAERWRQTPYDLNAQGLPADLTELEFRRVQASGTFDYANQVVLKAQNWNNQPGVLLVTPYVLDSSADGRAVLVLRGWVPLDQADPAMWPELEEAAGTPVVGLIQESQTMPNGEPVSAPGTPQREWFYLGVDAIGAQLPYALEPAYIQMLPEEGRTWQDMPIREEPLELTDGNHMSYALQWFMFAAILGFGYVQFVGYQERRFQREEQSKGQRDGGEDANPDVPAMPRHI